MRTTPMRRPLTASVLLASLLRALVAWGAPADVSSTARPMTLSAALAYAHEHQPALRAALARVVQRNEAAKVPSGQWLPVVGVTGQLFAGTANNTTASYVTPYFMDIPRIGGTQVSVPGTLRPYASTLVGAGITQEAFDFGRISAQRAAADALAAAERQAASAERLDIDLAVEEAYFAVWAAKGVLAAAEGAYVRSKAHRDLAKGGVDSGLRPPIELTRADAVLTRFDVGRVRARAGLATAQSVLAASIGTPDAAVDVAGEAPRAAEVPSLADAMQRAAARDPRILQALTRIKAEEEQTRAIGAELRPDVSLTGTVSGRAGGAQPSGNGDVATGDGLLPYVPNWDVGLVVTWPMFDGTVVARRDASRAMEQVRREELSVVREQQVATIEQTYIAFDVARNALPGLEQAVTAAHANYDQADARFRAGLGNAVELADAEDLRAASETDLALGQFEIARARSALGRAIAEGL
jgi:outer membrane protein